MIEQFKRRFNSLYWHQFALTAGMVLLTLLLLGVSFFTLSYGTTTADKRGEMRTRAEFVEITAAGWRESHVHDVKITKEAPNYRQEN